MAAEEAISELCYDADGKFVDMHQKVCKVLQDAFPGYDALLEFVTQYQAVYPVCACQEPHYVDGKRVKCRPCDAKDALAAAGVTP